MKSRDLQKIVPFIIFYILHVLLIPCIQTIFVLYSDHFHGIFVQMLYACSEPLFQKKIFYLIKIYRLKIATRPLNSSIRDFIIFYFINFQIFILSNFLGLTSQKKKK